VMATWTIRSWKTILNKKTVKHPGDELALFVCPSRWSSWG
jgi:hypothetical protein